MKTFRAKKGPFTHQPHFSVGEIESLCADELTRVGLMPSAPAATRIDRFIEKRFGKAHTYATLPDGILGLTVFGPQGVDQVVLSEALELDQTQAAERRIRTTLAHEAGHGLLHAHLFALDETHQPLFGDWSDPKKPKVLCRESSQGGGYSGEWWEYQANMVMAALLMPRTLVEIAVKGFLQPTGTLGMLALPTTARTAAIQTLAGIFDVNPVVARYRLDGLFQGETGGQLAL